MLIKIVRRSKVRFEVLVDGEPRAWFTRSMYSAGYWLRNLDDEYVECIGASAPPRHIRQRENRWYYFSPRQCDMTLVFEGAIRAGAVDKKNKLTLLLTKPSIRV